MPTSSTRRQFHRKVDLVDASADTLFEVAFATNKMSTGRFRVVVSCIDGSNEQQVSVTEGGWCFYNKSGTPAGALAPTPAEVTSGNQKSTGTLVVGTWVATAASGKITIGCTATSSIIANGSATLRADILIEQDQPNAITFV